MQHTTARSSSNPKKVYKFVELTPYSIQTTIKGKSFVHEFLQIEPDGKLTILCTYKPKGYAWDGCSPKVNWLDITWGTPDGMLDCTTQKPKTYYASLVHDVLYQYHYAHGLTRKQCDDLFYYQLKQANFKLAQLYYLAVRLFGGVAGNWKGRQRWW